MKRIVVASLLAVLFLAGCMTPGRAGFVTAVPAPVVVAHVHGPDCGHFWGVWEGQPVYYHHGLYSYWSGAVWVERARPPVVYRTRVYHPDARYHYASRVHHPDARYHYASHGSAPQDRWQSHAEHTPRQARPPQPSAHRVRPAR